jgi:phytoene desaturase
MRQSANPPIRQSIHPPIRKAIVIGSGVAGLAVAIRLAVKGYSVKVFERNAGPGGKLSFFEQDGYAFDAGPSLFTQPSNIEDLFELAGEPINEYFQYRSVPVACKYFFEDGTIVNAYTKADQLARELEKTLGEDPLAVKNYLARAGTAYEAIGKIFLDHSLHRSSTWLSKKIFPALSATRISYLVQSMHDYHTSNFRSSKTVQIFDRFATYNGSNPYKAPAMLSMIPHLEHNEGTFYPLGGMISITNALYKLAVKKGVEFVFNSKVDKIIHHQGKVTGVWAGGREFKADLVVSNMDVYYAYRDLLDDKEKAAEVLKRERSSSAMIFYWGIKKEFKELHLHNIFFTRDLAEEFRHLFETREMYHDPTIYVNITSKMEQGHCRQGTENWFVMLNAPADIGQNWDQIRQNARASAIDKLSRILKTDISALIETERVLDPKGIEAETLSHMGSLYGTSSNSKWAAFLRHPNFSSSIKGLYFTGGSVHPGGGIPLCLKSAKIVASMID